MTVEPLYFFAFAIAFFLGHILLRPYDLPRGMECLQNTGFILLIARAGFSVAQAGPAMMAGMVLAKQTGFPFRALTIPGRPDLTQPGLDLSTGTLLAVTFAISLAGIALARLTHTNTDLFGSRHGILGIGEAFDRFMTRRFSRRTAQFQPQASRPGDTASMVVIRPWALRPFRDTNSPEKQIRLVAKVRPGGHQLRLAHMLADAATHGNGNAETALRALLSLRQAVDLRSDPAFAGFL